MTGNGWGEQNWAAVRENLPERNIRGGIAEVAAHLGGGPGPACWPVWGFLLLFLLVNKELG